MKSLVGAFLAIMAINSAPGLSAATATYLTVLAVLLAVVVYVAVRSRRRRTTPVAPAAAAAPTIVQHIYTTQPVFTGIYHPGAPIPQPAHVHSERVGQVILPDSIYRRPAK